MTTKLSAYIALGLGLAFAVFFFVYVFPAALAMGDAVAAFAAGFVNPLSTGYSVDTIMCGVILAVWILFERHTLNIRFGWVCILLSIIPGVATGFGLYLFLRTNQLQTEGR